MNKFVPSVFFALMLIPFGVGASDDSAEMSADYDHILADLEKATGAPADLDAEVTFTDFNGAERTLSLREALDQLPVGDLPANNEVLGSTGIYAGYTYVSESGTGACDLVTVTHVDTGAGVIVTDVASSLATTGGGYVSNTEFGTGDSEYGYYYGEMTSRGTDFYGVCFNYWGWYTYSQFVITGVTDTTGGEVDPNNPPSPDDVVGLVEGMANDAMTQLAFAGCALGLGADTSTGDFPVNKEDVICILAEDHNGDGVANLALRADTVAHATAGDLVFCLSTSGDRSDCFWGADDSFHCTFPPPAYRCPAGSVSVEPGLYFLILGAFDSYSNPFVEYSFTATTDGTDATTGLAQDDRDQQGP